MRNKIMSVLLCATLVLGQSVPAFSAGLPLVEGENDETPDLFDGEEIVSVGEEGTFVMEEDEGGYETAWASCEEEDFYTAETENEEEELQGFVVSSCLEDGLSDEEMDASFWSTPEEPETVSEEEAVSPDDLSEEAEAPGLEETLTGDGTATAHVIGSQMLDECTPYLLTGSRIQESVTMGGDTFTDAVYCYIYSPARVGFNLGYLYDEISFYAGFLDGKNYSKVIMEIYCDGILTDTVEIGTDDLRRQYTYSVSGVEEFIVVFSRPGITDGNCCGIGGMTFIRSGENKANGRTITSNMKEECLPYILTGSDIYDRVQMGGITFTDAIHSYIYSPAKVGFNLNQSYDQISFYTGHEDGCNYTQVKMEVYEDGTLIDEQDLGRDSVPKQFSYSVTGVDQFLVVFSRPGIADGNCMGLGGIRFSPEHDHTDISLEENVSAGAGRTAIITGRITLNASEASESRMASAAGSLTFDSSDPAIAKVTSFDYTADADFRTAELKLYTAYYQEGEATITASMATGQSDTCQVVVSPDSSPAVNYESEEGTLSDFLSSQAARSNIKYLQVNANYPASTFVFEVDEGFGSQFSQIMTDFYYRGWDGWMDLIDGSTSIREAEKILSALLGVYQSECEALAAEKKALKYAKMVNKAFTDYLKVDNLYKALNSSQLKQAEEYFSVDHIRDMLVQGKYKELMIGPGVAQMFGKDTPKEWNNLMQGFMKSGEISKALNDGLKTLGGGLQDLSRGLKLLSLTEDTLNYYYRIESLLAADEVYCEMLLYLRENCRYSVVQEAAGNLYSTIQNSMASIIADVTTAAARLAGEKILDAIIDVAIGKLPVLVIVKAGYDWGVMLSEEIFHTGSIQEKKDQLRILAFAGDCLSLWVNENLLAFYNSNGNEADAGRLYYSTYMLWYVRDQAEGVLQGLMKDVRNDKKKNYAVSVQVKNRLEALRDYFFSRKNLEMYISTTVSCPVLLEVYTSAGRKVLTVEDGIETKGYQNGIYYYADYNPISGSYMKSVFLDENAGYLVKIVGADEGTVDCSVQNVERDGTVVDQYFEELSVEKDTVVTLGDLLDSQISYTVEKDGSLEGASMKTHSVEEKKEEVQVSLESASIFLEGRSFVYTGQEIQPAVLVICENKVLTEGKDYSLDYSNHVNAGRAVITVTGENHYTGSGQAVFVIGKADQSMTVSPKSPSLKADKLSRKKRTIKMSKAFRIADAVGAVTFIKKGGSKKLSISTTGTITAAKGTKKGVYKIKVAVTAAGDHNHNAAEESVTVKVKVK